MVSAEQERKQVGEMEDDGGLNSTVKEGLSWEGSSAVQIRAGHSKAPSPMLSSLPITHNLLFLKFAQLYFLPEAVTRDLSSLSRGAHCEG